jgi:adenylate kinase
MPAISTGELFRAECKAGTALGKLASAIIADGGLVGDGFVNSMVENRIAAADCAQGFLLDGYPRTVAQAQYFSKLLRSRGLAEPEVIHLNVPEDALVTRLSARRQCPKCLAIYNLLSQPPRREGICDGDGAHLLTRDDDRECVIRERLRAYRELTEPVLAWYGPTQVKTVDGSRSPEEVAEAIAQLVDCGCAAAC